MDKQLDLELDEHLDAHLEVHVDQNYDMNKYSNEDYSAYCQAQSEFQFSWTESALLSLLDPTKPNRPHPNQTGIVPRCSSRLAFAVQN